ncbi:MULTISPECIES: DUF1461 domain-containing protein [Gordonibacter]|uniref:DUF1461 domain-containing protein n=1 Tax=Gordonibacter faecis TaxID=3047475 RepID=A0ABT7DNH2_9ACTN|nr:MULTISPECIES: DUF1461 domain-containing protein [unclassified Gordonibacter]MDJ1651083.1 DUF1461 domain-containing protein [Gordonibacter sp. KGMB12511]HIW75387.1 DUF1461 domain-containing protein [Candidatus Gordonibacter avicola]
MREIVNKAAAVVAAFTLSITFVAAGFAMCAALPQTTEMLANAFSGMDNPATPFSHDDLVQAAVVTRDYTVGSNDREAVFALLHDINASANTRYATADDATLAAAPDVYTLDAEALSHLDDVYRVVVIARAVLIGVAVLAAVACVFVALRTGMRKFGGVLMAAGAGVLIVFALLAAWVLVDFNGFFAAFHSLFFADGTWTFSYESLLITMYPPAFWMGMGGVWLATTAGLSILALVIGIILRRRCSA